MNKSIAYLVAIVWFSAVVCGMVFVASGGKFYLASAAPAPAAASAPAKTRICLESIPDETVQGWCARWGDV